MTTIRNASASPLRVPLPGGKLLHLGPGRSAHVPDSARELRSFRALVDDGRIVIVGEGGPDDVAPRDTAAHGVSVHGHTHARRPLVTGDR